MSHTAFAESAFETAEGSLVGKVAVVTGAARGIGHAVAQAYAARGATVVIADIDASAAASAASALPNAVAVQCDVTNERSVVELFEHAVDRYAKVDIAVANAGIAGVLPIVEMPFATWRTMLSTNLDGVFLTVRSAARSMIASQTAGSIITMASVTALAGIPLAAHYAAAKAGVVSLTKTAALELRPAGIRVNAILPGFAETELVTANREKYSAALGIDFDTVITAAQGGYVSVDDVAGLALFLAGDRSRFCTGAGFVVDGGLTASLF
ncbi:oxidoreductase [Mycolicibacterium moriokaense]|uniref:Short-chain dehydrogenase n=1 Tax=Mycolicibacterium moriokaense TaxID=39691 RepID=A0AAD1HD90_9MYCO|nr:SDR family NAD(P)-dependent oxidoreductase [Mycolicibacterium moriokaense]MCV7038179.1 SDR family oxidoreductase [Mycolicibacterium moriokaense]ORB24177.1 oxidoreductase [Mycolicibacterium moriokaense]BBX02705.1 short-chain dehydrogenase [Mycolicibacterium moriokaense]